MAQENVVVLTGPKKGQRFEISSPFTIGRNKSCELRISHPEVSHVHAIIEPGGTGTVLRDHSTNGTYMGGRRVVECELMDGDVIRVGPVEFRYECQTPRDAGEQKTAHPIQRVEYAETELESSSTQDLFDSWVGAPATVDNLESLRNVQKRLMAVYMANQIIHEAPDLDSLLERVMRQVFELVEPDSGAILLREGKDRELVEKYVQVRHPGAKVHISRTIARRVADSGEVVFTPDTSTDLLLSNAPSVLQQHISSAVCVPLAHGGESLGVLYVDVRIAARAFTRSDQELLVALARPTSVAIRNAQMLLKVEQAYRDTLIALANAIELRDHYTVGHTWRVTNFAVQIAQELGWSKERCRECEIGGVLHDVGKIAVNDAILLKPDPLTEEESAVMRTHPERGVRLLEDVEFLRPIIPYVRYHHERYDGRCEGIDRGYPEGLSGENIPIEGRLIHVADAFDALTSSRPYKEQPYTPEDALEMLKKDRGKRADPGIVDALVRCHDKGKIQHILQHRPEQDRSGFGCPFCTSHIHVPEHAKLGGICSCRVCRRAMRTRREGAKIIPELLSAAESDMP